MFNSADLDDAQPPSNGLLATSQPTCIEDVGWPVAKITAFSKIKTLTHDNIEKIKGNFNPIWNLDDTQDRR